MLHACKSPVTEQETFTRGIGVYPGEENENFAPVLTVGGNQHRNLALNRSAWHSGSYDYSLTAQLVTDGIIDTEGPWRLSAATGDEAPLNRILREYLTDDNPVTAVNIQGSSAWVQMGFEGWGRLPEVDGIRMILPLRDIYRGGKGPWRCTVSGSDDGQSWEKINFTKGNGSLADTAVFPVGDIFRPFVRFKKKVHYRYYRVHLESSFLKEWNIGEFVFYHDGQPVEVKTSCHFVSAWMSDGAPKSWICTDLGAVSQIDSLLLYWIHPPAAGYVEVSNDRKEWKIAKAFDEKMAKISRVVFDAPVEGRYVRMVLVDHADGDYYVLSEMEVYGTGGVKTVAKKQPVAGDDKMMLSGGNWKLQRASLADADGVTLSQGGFDDSKWLTATVPATVLVSYKNAGAVPDPNYSDNQLMVSESFFLSDFWYRNVFTVPGSWKNKHFWLNFDGINWKAEVYLNGQEIGKIDGAFMRGRFDVSDLLLPGKENVVAVKIIKNAHPGGMKEKTYESPGLNGGVLGADNPTFHATVGWDWIPTIRGRDAGIWNDVYLTATGPVTLENPFVQTDLPLPDTTAADVTISVTVINNSSEDISGVLTGSFGKINFEQPVDLKGGESKLVTISPETHEKLHIKNPKLWWPAGYGAPNLYPVKLSFSMKKGHISDSKTFRTGIREMAYSEEGGRLKIWVNGKRFVGRGGNWGFPESMLQYRGREYDIVVRYHKDMNFTMIRNWVGMTGDEEFFEACDRHGVMIWQDFWLANPWDGPDPDDNDMFLANAEDFVLKIRNHPSIALYCGRNEGYPPKALDDGLRQILRKNHPGLHYIPNSAADVVSGHGPYRAMPVKFYFAERAKETMHSEMGMPNVVTIESLEQMMPDSLRWPQGRAWGLHDFCSRGAMQAESFRQIINEQYGGADSLKDWMTLAQFVNYDGYRAMFEAQSRHRMGLLLWMSHPAWPSFAWQTYDYYFEPTAAYFGCKHASEPLHIQWNALTDSIEAVNYSGKDAHGLDVTVEVVNMDGTVKSTRELTIDLPEDRTVRCLKMAYPEDVSAVHFIRLTMKKGQKIISRNFYLRGREDGNLTAIRTMPVAQIGVSNDISRKGDQWQIRTVLKNNSATPALMVRVKVIGSESGERILPVLYSDNYIALMPGEERAITMELANEDTRGETPAVSVSGFNAVMKK